MTLSSVYCALTFNIIYRRYFVGLLAVCIVLDEHSRYFISRSDIVRYTNSNNSYIELAIKICRNKVLMSPDIILI